jgi:hypothetical protein
VEDIVPLAEPPQPKLTETQRQWIEKFNNLLPNDFDGLSALSLEISTAAAAKQVAAPPPPSRNPARPNQGGNRAPHRRPRYDPQDASTIQKLYKLDRNKAMTHILAEPSPYCTAEPLDIETHLFECLLAMTIPGLSRHLVFRILTTLLLRMNTPSSPLPSPLLKSLIA